MIDHNTPKVQAALQYASLGWKVFPLRPLSKEPLLPLSWPQIATTDAWQIVEWWAEYPDANIAIVAGADLCIVDVDRKSGKADGWAAIGHLVQQDTMWCATPNQGYHFYYQGGGPDLHAVPGVDIQSGNRYVVAPPSRLLQGDYTWGRSPTPWDPPALVPFELVALLQKPSAPRETLPWETSDIPDLLPPWDCPSWQSLWPQLKPSHQWFLHDGSVFEFPSRSELIHSIIHRLYRIGLQDAEVLTLLWENPWVQETALEHRRDHTDRGLQYLWDSCKKLRQYRKKSVEEIFQPVATQNPSSLAGGAYAGLRDQAGRLSVTEDIHGFLKEVAAGELGPLEKDLILDICKRAGFAKAPLKAQLAVYEREVQALNKHQGAQWVHTYGEEERPLGTKENLEVLLAVKKACIKHNLMDHRLYLTVNDQPLEFEDKFNIQLTQVRSWAAEYRMPLDTIVEQLTMLAHTNAYHPFREFVERRSWDGTNRVQRVIDTVKVPESKAKLKQTLMTRWLVSLVAAVYGYGTRAPRGVLTFTGKQRVGKTTWLQYLVPKGMYHEGLLLRAEDRDSATKGLRYLLVELGDVESTFRKSDLEALKSFIGRREDVWRFAYDRDESIWPRRTVFAASANDNQLLKDQTGNTRWWVLPAEAFDLDAMESWWGGGEGYELQQFWAEVLLMYRRGDKWDLDDQELAFLESHLEEHVDETAIGSAIRDVYQWEKAPPAGGYKVPKRFLDIARDIGLHRPFTATELATLRPMLQRLTGQDSGRLRRINLATLDGKKVNQEWQKEIEDEERRGVTKAGRWWFVPPKEGEIARET